MATPPSDKQSVLDRLQGRFVEFYETYGLEFNNDNRCPCPIHQGQDPNFSVNPRTGMWFCHSSCQTGGDVFLFVERVAGVDFPEALRRIGDWVGVQPTAAAPHSPKNGSKSNVATAATVTATYDYHDAQGALQFQVERMVEASGRKTFRQRRPDGKGGYIYNLDGVKRVLYRLPQLLAAIAANRTVFIVEGEKDVETLERLGLTATTNAGGADDSKAPIDGSSKWPDHFSDCFKDAKVILIPDNDPPGRAHVRKVAGSLYKRTRRIRILELPDLPEKGDVTDWLNAGHTKKELNQLAAAAPNWVPIVDVSSASSEVASFIKQYMRDRDDEDPIEVHSRLSRAVYEGTTDAQDGEARLVSLDDYLERVSDPPPAIAEGLLAQHDLILLTGSPKGGKSYIILDLLESICRGGKVFGEYPVRQKGPVVYLAMEDNPVEISRRIHMRGTMKGCGLPFYIIENRIQLGSAEGVLKLEEMITALKLDTPPVCVVIDTARIGFQVDNWNDAAEVTRRMLGILDFARRTCLVIIVAHNRKGAGDGGDVISGTNALQSISDGYMIAQSKKRHDNGDLEIPLFIETRAAPPRTITLIMDTKNLHMRCLTPDEEVTRAAAESANREIEQKGKIADALDKLRHDNPHQTGWTVPAIMNKSGVKRTAIYPLIKSMLAAGEISKVGELPVRAGGSGVPAALYRLTTTGAKYLLFGPSESPETEGS